MPAVKPKKTKKYMTKRRRKNNLMFRAVVLCGMIGALVINAVGTYTVNQIGQGTIHGVNVARAENMLEMPEFEASEPINETSREKIMRISKEQCLNQGLDDYCWKDLVAMAHTEESSFNCKAVGDGGKSYGCFQIHRGYHKSVTIEEAQDPEYAVKWTLNRLVSKGYPVYRSNAIMLHNGTPGIPKTLDYLSKVNKYAESL